MINWRHIKQDVEQNMFLDENENVNINEENENVNINEEAVGHDSFRVQNEIFIDENLSDDDDDDDDDDENIMLEIERLQNEVLNYRFERIVIFMAIIIMGIIVTYYNFNNPSHQSWPEF